MGPKNETLSDSERSSVIKRLISMQSGFFSTAALGRAQRNLFHAQYQVLKQIWIKASPANNPFLILITIQNRNHHSFISNMNIILSGQIQRRDVHAEDAGKKHL
jgi:hypothetical protein